MALPCPRRVTIPVTMACPVCGSPFTPSGRRRCCSDACRAAAYRRRRAVTRPVVAVPAAVRRVPLTIYECDGCGARAVGEQRCRDCYADLRIMPTSDDEAAAA
jgi:predicted nucleic acid-binding Zn ribbon protein